MAKPRRKPPNKTEKLAAVLLMIKRGDGWLIPEPLRSTGDAEAICKGVEWHHEYRHAIKPGNDPRMLTPMREADHEARFARDMKEITKVKRGLRKRAGQKRKWPPIPGSKASPWRKPMRGPAERRAP